jgi:magnesium transporter
MFRKRHPQMGATPGTLLLHPDQGTTWLRVVIRREGVMRTFSCTRVQEIPELTSPEDRLWLDVQGLGDGEVLAALARRFHIQPLAMEDLVNVPQRPKTSLYDHQQLIVAHMLSLDDSDDVVMRQLGLVIGEQYVLTFHQDCSAILAPIRDRLRNPAMRLMDKDCDYLAYAILDSCVDGYFPVMEELGEMLESLEEQSLRNPHPELLAEIHQVKNQLIGLRRSVWPQREMVMSLATTESPFIAPETREYFRDVLDHCAQLADVVEMYRESATGLVNTYMTAVAHRSNEIVKVLTLLTSVFVPPTFIAGIYGMNFSDMPELAMENAYPVVMLAMLAMICGTILYFYFHGWLSRAPIGTRGRKNRTSETFATNRSRTILLEESQPVRPEVNEATSPTIVRADDASTSPVRQPSVNRPRRAHTPQSKAGPPQSKAA